MQPTHLFQQQMHELPVAHRDDDIHGRRQGRCVTAAVGWEGGEKKVLQPERRLLAPVLWKAGMVKPTFLHMMVKTCTYTPQQRLLVRLLGFSLRVPPRLRHAHAAELK
jgi:hypothetical protein